MDALVMCGGAGTRLGQEIEKPMYEIDHEPMVDRVIQALRASRVESIVATVSPATPETHAYLADLGVETMVTPGDGYVEDLAFATDELGSPLLTVAADLPLLAAEPIDRVLAREDGDNLTVALPAALKRLLGLSLEYTFAHEGRELTPTGLNVVSEHEPDRVHVSHDVRLAVNVNTPSDAQIAERLQ